MDEKPPRAVLRGEGGRYHPISLQSMNLSTALALVLLGTDRRAGRFPIYLENGWDSDPEDCKPARRTSPLCSLPTLLLVTLIRRN